MIARRLVVFQTSDMMVNDQPKRRKKFSWSSVTTASPSALLNCSALQAGDDEYQFCPKIVIQTALDAGRCRWVSVPTNAKIHHGQTGQQNDSESKPMTGSPKSTGIRYNLCPSFLLWALAATYRRAHMWQPGNFPGGSNLL